MGNSHRIGKAECKVYERYTPPFTLNIDLLLEFPGDMKNTKNTVPLSISLFLLQGHKFLGFTLFIPSSFSLLSLRDTFELIHL
ncbi:A/G-specific adenine glycosylase [Sesbania bispinosa]|nr:A/G-specific adenine glycosylase [Sesbania bispinosa]